MTGGEVIGEVAGHLDLDSADILADATLLARFIGYLNDALAALTAYGDWEWLRTAADVTTVDAQATVNLPADFAALMPDSAPYYGCNGPYPLRLIGHLEIERFRATAVQSGRPSCYRLLAGEIDGDTHEQGHLLDLYPTPDAAYAITVPYRKLVPVVALAADVIAIPPSLQRVLVLGAKCEAEEGWERMPQSPLRPKYAEAVGRAWGLFNSPSRDQRLGQLRPLGRSAVREMCERETPAGSITIIAP